MLSQDEDVLDAHFEGRPADESVLPVFNPYCQLLGSTTEVRLPDGTTVGRTSPRSSCEQRVDTAAR